MKTIGPICCADAARESVSRGTNGTPSVRRSGIRMTLHLGGKEIQILYLGRAHTRGDSIIFVPQIASSI